MKQQNSRGTLVGGVVAAAASVVVAGAAIAAQPPETRTDGVVDDYHGTRIADPYRWLEGDNSDPQRMGRPTAEVSAWTDTQNAYTRSVLDGLPGREALERRLKELLYTTSVGAPVEENGRRFFTRREAGQNQSVLLVLDDENASLEDARVLLDPNAVDESGLTTLSWWAPSPDGELLAFGMYIAGDENSTLYVLRVDDGTWLADEIPGKTGFTRWLPDSSGFFYRNLESVDDPYSGVQRLHTVGTHHRQDKTLFRQRDIAFFYGDRSEEEQQRLATTWGPSAYVSEDASWMIVSYWTGTDSVDLWVVDLDEWRRTGELRKVEAAVGERGRVLSMHVRGDTAYLATQHGAPNGRVAEVDLTNPSYENWQDVVEERDEVVITGVSFAEDFFAVNGLERAQSLVRLARYDGGAVSELPLPGIGTASLSADPDSNTAYLGFSSYDTPPTTFAVDLQDVARRVERGSRENIPATYRIWFRPNIPVDPSAVEVKQVTYSSGDGTPVTMFIVHKQGIELDGTNPTILYGYGGFNISMTPGFSSSMFPWYENGGVYAIANLRGGGEYGAKWHSAGMLGNKQNVFDDFIAAAEYLIDEGYTSSQHLGVAGGSNGGLLTGAMVAQRPDLVSAAIVAVPLLDMLRYQKFLMARYWVPEYGTAESAADFEFLRAYSPYHNIEKGVEYPAVLVTAGENDTRVHPLHARKFAAMLQASSASDPNEEPVLLWVDREGGHGAGKPLDLIIRDIADQRLFMMWQLGMIERAD